MISTTTRAQSKNLFRITSRLKAFSGLRKFLLLTSELNYRSVSEEKQEFTKTEKATVRNELQLFLVV